MGRIRPAATFVCVVLLACLWSGSCGSSVDRRAGEQQFADSGIQFRYPHSWIVVRQTVPHRPNVPKIKLRGPSGAQLFIAPLPPEADSSKADLRALLEEARDSSLLELGDGSQVSSESYSPWVFKTAQSQHEGLAQSSVVQRRGLTIHLRVTMAYAVLSCRAVAVVSSSDGNEEDEKTIRGVLKSLECAETAAR